MGFPISAVALQLATPLAAPELAETVSVRFAKGLSSKVIHASIRGYATVDYMISVRISQTMTIRMTTKSRSCYFNVTPPVPQAAGFNGFVAGNRFSTKIPSTGTYMVQVYLIPDAAQRNENASYTLNISVL